LPGELPAETASEQINTLERIRALVGEINQLRRDRFEKIEQDIHSFATAAAELVRTIATDLAEHIPDRAIAEIERRLESAKRIRERQRQADEAIASLEKRRQEGDDAIETAEQSIQALQAMAGAPDPEQLREMIRRATRSGQLKAQRAEIEDQLASDGDGLPLPKLQQECAGVDLDQIASHENTVRTEIQALQEQRAEAAERRQIARQAFEAVGGDSEASRAAAARQCATWLSGTCVLGRQPLLKRAGLKFAQLTSGSFTELRVEYDAEDQAQLAGLRPHGVRRYIWNERWHGGSALSRVAARLDRGISE
jgi:DNA repair exonuclease SbcCD ATPase subunit